MKPQKKMTLSRSSKASIAQAKDNLPPPAPEKPSETPGAPQAGSPGASQAIPQEPITPEAIQIKATGLGARAVCLVYDKFFRGPGPVLRPHERVIFQEPADKLEVELMKLLPDWLQAQMEKHGPLVDAAMGIVIGFNMISRMRAEEMARAAAVSAPKPAAAADTSKPGKEPVEVNVE